MTTYAYDDKVLMTMTDGVPEEHWVDGPDIDTETGLPIKINPWVVMKTPRPREGTYIAVDGEWVMVDDGVDDTLTFKYDGIEYGSSDEDIVKWSHGYMYLELMGFDQAYVWDVTGVKHTVSAEGYKEICKLAGTKSAERFEKIRAN